MSTRIKKLNDNDFCIDDKPLIPGRRPKLSPAERETVRNRYAIGQANTSRRLCREFNIGKTTLNKIINGYRYAERN